MLDAISMRMLSPPCFNAGLLAWLAVRDLLPPAGEHPDWGFKLGFSTVPVFDWNPAFGRSSSLAGGSFALQRSWARRSTRRIDFSLGTVHGGLPAGTQVEDNRKEKGGVRLLLQLGTHGD